MIFKNIILKGENAIHEFWNSTKQEVDETEEAEKVLVKVVGRKSISTRRFCSFGNQQN